MHEACRIISPLSNYCTASAQALVEAEICIDTDQLKVALASESPKSRLSAIKQYHQSTLQQSEATLRTHLSEGLLLCQRLSQSCDALLCSLVEVVSAGGKLDAKALTLVAIGGYGRSELYPKSDVDIVLLVANADRITSAVRQSFEKILYLLWDAGFKVGHAVHSSCTAMQLAKTNTIFATALLDARLICGSQHLFRQLKTQQVRLIRAQQTFLLPFIAEKYQELRQRHQQNADHKQQLEPNIKEGIGTLRDLQQIHWMTTVIDTALDNGGKIRPSYGLMSVATLQKFQRAYRFLSSLRFLLHCLPEGQNNRLQFHQQPEIAQIFRYRHHHALTPMMRLMKYYHQQRYHVECLSQIVEQRLTKQGFLPSKNSNNKSVPCPRLHYVPTTFSTRSATRPGKDTPDRDDDKSMETANKTWLIRHLIGDNDEKLALDADIMEASLSHPHLISAWKHHPAALTGIRRLICQPDNQDQSPAYSFPHRSRLYWLTRLGVLGRLLPEFGHINGLGQWDGYHAFSVDSHTLNVISTLHNIWQLSDDSPYLLANTLMKQSSKLDCLFVAAFFHDIAKGMGGRHAEKGAVIANRIAPLMGFDATETNLVTWLVRHHLLLSDLALHRDILDPSTVNVLLEKLDNADQLNLLYCLTVADISAVSSQSWTAWKASVLERLYKLAQPRLNHAPNAQERISKKRLATDKLRTHLSRCDDATFAEHINNCSGEYLLSTELPLQINHATMLMGRPTLKPRESVIEFLPNPENDIVQLVVYTTNYIGLFAHIMATLSQVGLAIVTMKTFPYANHNALLTVWFHDNGRAIVEERRLNNLRAQLGNNIAARFVNLQTPARYESTGTQDKDKHEYLNIKTRIHIDNQASQQATVFEIQTQNRPHLLFDLSLAFNDCKVSIHAAKIDTFGKRALDVFYIRNRFGLKILEEDHLRQIRQRLQTAISQPTPTQSLPPSLPK